MSDNDISPPRAKYATFERFVADLPAAEKVSVYKLYELARKGALPVYKVADTKSAVVNIAEARALLRNLSAQGKIRRGYGTFGPDSDVRDLTKVVLPPGEVLQ